MAAISNRQPEVLIEYDAKGKRIQKLFADAHKAKRFYVQKDKAGKNPKVIRPNRQATKFVACYVRVSTAEQNETSQIDEIKRRPMTRFAGDG